MTPTEQSEANTEIRDVDGGVRQEIGWPRMILSAILPPLVALLGEEYLFIATARWSLFYPAVFLSSWIGGYWSGVVATFFSTALAWYFLVPPQRTAITTDPKQILAAGLFVTMGLLFSGLQGRLRRLNVEAATALAEARRTAERLRVVAAERRVLAALVENSSDFVGIASDSGRVLYVNPAGRRMVGIAPDFPLETVSVASFYPPELREFAANEMLPAIREKGVWHGETALRHWQTGARIPVAVTGFEVRDSESDRVLGLGTITRDISAEKRARDELQATNTRLADTTRALQDAQRVAHVGSWTWTPKSDVIQWSEELYRIFGVDPSRPPPRLLSAEPAFLTQESRKQLDAAFAKLREHGTPYELELEIERPNGDHRWLATRGEAVKNEHGIVVELTGTVQDITELKRLQQMKEEWTSVIAHDLRQPIGFILMAADFLPELHAGEMSEKEHDFTRRIRSAAHTLARMVDDLSDLSLLEAKRLKLECTWVQPHELVKETLSRVSYLTGDRQVRVTEERALPDVYVDAMRIVQVLGNLVSNAVKYGEPGSEIVLQVHRRGDEVELSVTNRGRGITPDELPRLFSRFTRSRSARETGVPGLGIGLYISKGLVEAHGGRLWAESTPGETTTFHVTLPTRATAREAA